MISQVAFKIAWELAWKVGASIQTSPVELDEGVRMSWKGIIVKIDRSGLIWIRGERVEFDDAVSIVRTKLGVNGVEECWTSRPGESCSGKGERLCDSCRRRT